jgi:hypothetical protein
MSIIDPKYRTKYTKEAKDWLAKTIDGYAVEAVTREKTTTAEDGTKTTETVRTAQTRLDIDKLFALAEGNKLNVDKYRADVEKKNAPGRLRMTIGNMLRAVARKRLGLFVDGVWVPADEAFVGELVATETQDGTPIAKAKAAAEAPAEDEVAA